MAAPVGVNVRTLVGYAVPLHFGSGPGASSPRALASAQPGGRS
jgi:hypothetical protein